MWGHIHVQHLWDVGECPLVSHIVSQAGEVAPCGQSVGRHRLVVYEPADGRVSTRVNGLLYSLPVREAGKTVVCRLPAVAQG